MSYTTDDLIAKVKLWAAIPNTQPAYTDAQILDLMSDEMYNIIVPLIMEANENYFLTHKDYTIASATSEYELPSNAIGTTVDEVKVITSNDETINIPLVTLYRYDRHEQGYYIRGNYLNLLNPQNYNGKTLRVWYFYRPNELILAASARAITAINTGTKTLTFASLPSTWTAGKYDMIKANAPYTLFAVNETGTESDPDIVFTNTLSTDLAVGDYVAQTGYSPVANIPHEALGLLVQSTVIKILEGLKDTQGINNAVQKYKQMEQRLINLIQPRVKDVPQKLRNYNSFITNYRTNY